MLPLAAYAGDDGAARQTQQVAALVDYIAADYPAAVKDGQVVDESEYAEQRNLIEEASKLLPRLGGSEEVMRRLAERLQAVRAAVEDKQSGR